MVRNDARTVAAAFFQSYAATFAHADAAAILDHFAFPSHITSEAQEVTLTPIASREEGARMVEQLLDMYRDVGVAAARVLELAVLEVSPRVLLALVHWSLDDAAGTSVYAFEAAYTLASFDGALRITAIAHNEVLRYRECLEQIGA
jgi:hypothetical protein